MKIKTNFGALAAYTDKIDKICIKNYRVINGYYKHNDFGYMTIRLEPERVLRIAKNEIENPDAVKVIICNTIDGAPIVTIEKE